MFENMPDNHDPMFCIYNQVFNKFIGYSIGADNSLVHLCTLESDMSVQKIKIMKIDKLQKWAGMEFSTDNNLLVTASSVLDQKTNEECLKLIALDISDNKRLNIVSKLELRDTDYGLTSVQFMRKVKGYDVFMIASGNSILVVELKNTSFKVLNCLEDIVSGYIFEIAIFGSYILPIGTMVNGGSETLKVIQFGEQPVIDSKAKHVFAKVKAGILDS